MPTHEGKSAVKSVLWSLGKISIAGAFIAAIMKFTPILDLFYLFAMIVVIPLGFLSAIGMITEESFNLVAGPINNFFARAREQGEERFEEFKSQTEDTEPRAAEY